jgi:two-component system, LytTR family, response regulator
MIKAIIIDDEKLATEIICTYLQAFDDVIEVKAICHNGFDGFKAIQKDQPDLIFLDIQMPKLTGFELLELMDAPPLIIFTTAYDQYALKAFEQNAVDYLLKPFSQERFEQAVRKALQINLKEEQTTLQKLQHDVQEDKQILDRVVVKTGHKIEILKVSQVHYLQAEDDYVRIVAEKGDFLKQSTMKYYESHLPANEFVRVHRSYLVNVSQISRVEPMEKSSHVVKLRSGEKLPVSKSGYQKLKEMLGW